MHQCMAYINVKCKCMYIILLCSNPLSYYGPKYTVVGCCRHRTCLAAASCTFYLLWYFWGGHFCAFFFFFEHCIQTLECRIWKCATLQACVQTAVQTLLDRRPASLRFSSRVSGSRVRKNVRGATDGAFHHNLAPNGKNVSIFLFLNWQRRIFLISKSRPLLTFAGFFSEVCLLLRHRV